MKTLIIALCAPLLIFAHTINYYPGGPLEIIKIGHPTLTMVAEEIPVEDIDKKDTQELIDDMIKTMKSAGGVGLAAPQVNISKRLFVMKPGWFSSAEAIINPVVDYDEESGMKSSTEGCLSIPGRNFRVQRYNRINVTYFDRHGNFNAKEEKGFRAVVFQHEYDHLNGVMISDFFDQEFISSDKLEQENVPRM